jgi:purine catabolism regulator
MGRITPAEQVPAPARPGFVTLEQFVEQLRPELRLLHDGGSGQELLRWVEPSELEDPTPYLPEGEFLLTCGLPFLGDGGSEAGVDAYVRRLVDAGVPALGFGIQPYFDAVPEVLVSACRRRNLTLFEVPSTLPFAAIGLEFSQLLESENARAFRQLADTNRQLMRAVLSPRPEHELLGALAQKVPVWALLVGTDGRIRARGNTPEIDHALLAPLVERLFSGSGPRVEMDGFDQPGSALVYGHPLRSTKDANLGALILGCDAPLTAAQNSVVQAAIGLLELLVRQRTSGSLAPSQLATAVLLHPDSLTNGDTRHLNVLKDLLAQSLSSTRSAPMRVVQGIRVDPADGPPGDGPIRELLQWRRLFDTKLVEITDYGFTAITRLRVDSSLLADVERMGWRLVVGEGTELSGLAAAYQRVSSLRARVQSSGRSVRADDVTWSVAGLLGREAGTALAERLLHPVLSLEPHRRDPLLAVLSGWLHENGSWDGAAKRLQLHRNSVRRQIGVLAELLGMDLGSAQNRAELLIALQYLDEVNHAPATD